PVRRGDRLTVPPAAGGGCAGRIGCSAYRGGMSSQPGMVDWDLAVSTATRLISPGPEVSRSEADAAVRSLREQVEVAAAHVEQITALHPVGPIPVTRVVDRPGWVRVNAEGMSQLLTPLVQTLEE